MYGSATFQDGHVHQAMNRDEQTRQAVPFAHEGSFRLCVLPGTVCRAPPGPIPGPGSRSYHRSGTGDHWRPERAHEIAFFLWIVLTCRNPARAGRSLIVRVRPRHPTRSRGPVASCCPRLMGACPSNHRGPLAIGKLRVSVTAYPAGDGLVKHTGGVGVNAQWLIARMAAATAGAVG